MSLQAAVTEDECDMPLLPAGAGAGGDQVRSFTTTAAPARHTATARQSGGGRGVDPLGVCFSAQDEAVAKMGVHACVGRGYIAAMQECMAERIRHVLEPLACRAASP